jgi:cell division septum initiation protein DivIVA
MPYATAEARQRLLDTVAQAIEQLAVAIGALGDAYDQLDEQSAERMEQQLFRPTQLAYGRLQRTHASFAERHGLVAASFTPPAAGAPSTGAKALLERAAQEVANADHTLAELQDSMLPVEVGDRELREGLSAVREAIAELPARARRLMRAQGR